MVQKITAIQKHLAVQLVQHTVNAINHVAPMGIAIKANAPMKHAHRMIAVSKL